MAASMTRMVTLTTSRQKKLLTLVYKAVSGPQNIKKNSSTIAPLQQNEIVLATEVDEEERIESLRDISGLTEPQKRRLRGQVPEVVNDYQRSVRFQRKLYGKLGSESGVDPRLSWPPRQKAQELAELYREWEPPLEERMVKLKMETEEKVAKINRREKKVQENMAKMDKWIVEYRNRQKQKQAELDKKEDKKRKILQDAREYFGYYVDPRDPRFQEMLEEKEKQEKEQAKKQKKEQRMEKMAARLQLMAKAASDDKVTDIGQKNDSDEKKSSSKAD